MLNCLMNHHQQEANMMVLFTLKNLISESVDLANNIKEAFASLIFFGSLIMDIYKFFSCYCWS